MVAKDASSMKFCAVLPTPFILSKRPCCVKAAHFCRQLWTREYPDAVQSMHGSFMKDTVTCLWTTGYSRTCSKYHQYPCQTGKAGKLPYWCQHLLVAAPCPFDVWKLQPSLGTLKCGMPAWGEKHVEAEKNIYYLDSRHRQQACQQPSNTYLQLQDKLHFPHGWWQHSFNI